MASVIRIKRKRNEEPAPAIVVSCKKPRKDDGLDEPLSQNVLTLVGTVKSGVS